MSIEVGTSATVTLVVSEADTAIAHRSGDVAVLATPRLAALLEEASVAALGPSIEVTATSVGVHIAIAHLAASPVGASVAATATVSAVNGRRIDFDLEAKEADKLIATGSHRRLVVDRAGFMASV
jgi:predicted thioesterase